MAGERVRVASRKPIAPRPPKILAGATTKRAREALVGNLELLGDEAGATLASRDGTTDDGGYAVARREADGSIVLTRDPIGHRTMYYARVADGYAFASSARLLALALPDIRPSFLAIALYLSCAYVPERHTLVEDVFEVLPGEEVRLGKSVKRRLFWTPPPEPRTALSEDALCRDLRTRLEESVLRRLPQGTVAASLSGGIDSSAVVALAKKLAKRQVRTYSISFGPEYPNELEWSSLVARSVKTDHTIVVLEPDAVSASIDGTMALLEKPIGDPLTVPNALLFREVAHDSASLFNGEGGDPCFGGPKNIPMVAAEVYGDRRLSAFLRAHLKCWDDLPSLLAPDLQPVIGQLESEVGAIFDRTEQRRFISRLQAVNVLAKGGQHILPKVEQLGRAFGVSALSPLFDLRIVEQSFAVPPGLKLRGNVEKYLFKRSVEDLLPHAVVHRPKSGMLVPVEKWFSGPLLDEARTRIMDGLATTGWFDRTALARIVEGKSGFWRPRRGAKIWLLIALEAWWRTLMDERAAARANRRHRPEADRPSRSKPAANAPRARKA